MQIEYSYNAMLLDDLDSFMFQTVGHQGIKYIAQAMGLPIYRYPTFGKANVQEKYYYPTENDEVEDLFKLLSTVKVE
jgi:diphthine-ammonia ligase